MIGIAYQATAEKADLFVRNYNDRGKGTNYRHPAVSSEGFITEVEKQIMAYGSYTGIITFARYC